MLKLKSSLLYVNCAYVQCASPFGEEFIANCPPMLYIQLESITICTFGAIFFIKSLKGFHCLWQNLFFPYHKPYMLW